MIVLILPVITPREETVTENVGTPDEITFTKNVHFTEVWNKIESSPNIKVERLPTKQCASDGVFKCDSKGAPLRVQPKIKLDTRTLLEATPETPAEFTEEVDDFVEWGHTVTYKIHPQSDVQQADIDKHLEAGHLDYGNGMTSPFKINGKYCTVIVLEDGETISDADFESLAANCLESTTT